MTILVLLVATTTLVAVCNGDDHDPLFNYFNLRTTTCTTNECGASAGSDERVHARFVRTEASIAATQLPKAGLWTHLDNLLINDREPGWTDTHSIYWDGALSSIAYVELKIDDEKQDDWCLCGVKIENVQFARDATERFPLWFRNPCEDAAVDNNGSMPIPCVPIANFWPCKHTGCPTYARPSSSHPVTPCLFMCVPRIIFSRFPQTRRARRG
jgi:hypothetical protein